MNISWVNSDKVMLEMEAWQYQQLIVFLALLQITMKGKKLSKDIPILDEIHGELYNAMEGRHDVKQRERQEK